MDPKHSEKYDEAMVQVAQLIDTVSDLISLEKEQQGLIALWGLSFAHQDLVNLYHRLGNLKFTIRKGKKKAPKKRKKK